INDYDDEELAYKFNFYKYFFNDLILTLNEYKHVFTNLEVDDLEEITAFFKEYSQYSDDKEGLKEAFNLLKKIKNGDVENKIANRLVEIIKQNRSGDIAIVCVRDFTIFS
ncbi:hypothetical protein RPN65_00580, partial [Staphylococcus ureilyticus]|nr:hypothetical protein [Staphylococcus ureilyticus]